MKPQYAVRHSDRGSDYYEVYRVADGAGVSTFRYRTEGERAIALAKANATRNDINEGARRKATNFEYDPAKMFPFASKHRMTD